MKRRLIGALALAATLVLDPISAERVSAQDRRLEEVLVTGSNIRRNRDFDTPSPIQTLGMENIEAAGAGQTQDLLRTLTVNAGSELSTSQNGRQGVSQFSLRGLGASGTPDAGQWPPRRAVADRHGRRLFLYGHQPVPRST